MNRCYCREESYSGGHDDDCPIQMARAEVERLARWKAEATLVLDQWDEVYDALGQPGELGELKSEAALAEVIRLRTENERLRDLVKGVGWLVAESDAALGGERE